MSFFLTHRSVLNRVDSLRKSLQESGKSYAKRAANAVSKQAAMDIALEGCQVMESMYRKNGKAVDDLKSVSSYVFQLIILSPVRHQSYLWCSCGP